MKKHQRKIFNRKGAIEPSVRGEERRGKQGKLTYFLPFSRSISLSFL
jgi:hypothetical protein